MPRTDYGQVELVLGDETHLLKPTLAALRQINRQHGSIREAIQRCSLLDFDALCAVVVAGAGLEGKAAKELPEALFAAGMTKAVGPVSEYLALLMNPTGQEPTEGDEGKG